MNIREEFNNQWHDIENVVLSDAKRQIKFHGKVTPKKLTEKLEQETSKWQRGVLVWGVFYTELANKDSAKALLFAETSDRLKFTEPDNNRIPSTWWVSALCLIPVAIIAFVLLKYTELSYIEYGLYPTLSFVILNALCMPIKTRMNEEATNLILKDIEYQMNYMKSNLEQYL